MCSGRKYHHKLGAGALIIWHLAPSRLTGAATPLMHLVKSMHPITHGPFHPHRFARKDELQHEGTSMYIIW